MKALLSACLLFTSCASVRPDGTSNCQITVAGDFNDRLAYSALDQPTLDKFVNRALDAASFTTDWRLGDQLANCQALVGYRVYTNQQPAYDLKWWDGKTYNIAGHTRCELKYIVVGTPRSVDWANSALVHEMFHAFQHCEAPLPIDEGQDDAHSNWVRDNFYNAIEGSRAP